MDLSVKAMTQAQDESKSKRRDAGTVLLRGAVFASMGIGLLAPLFGLAFIIIHSAIAEDRIFGQIGTILMIVSIPMLLVGSHFMDLLAKKK